MNFAHHCSIRGLKNPSPSLFPQRQLLHFRSSSPLTYVTPFAPIARASYSPLTRRGTPFLPAIQPRQIGREESLAWAFSSPSIRPPVPRALPPVFLSSFPERTAGIFSSGIVESRRGNGERYARYEVLLQQGVRLIVRLNRRKSRKGTPTALVSAPFAPRQG